jgi:phosphatidylserine/phosphatidylglycerophosphate/cardiolipin synthase-like enzyme
MEPPKTLETSTISLENKRDAIGTSPWFVPRAKYPPRPGNVIEPLINGERAFAAVHEAINAAKKTIDIISWGFDPSMRLLRPDGERLGELLRRKAEGSFGPAWDKPVQVRILIWKNAAANFGENNIIGDGFLGSGGGGGLGSGVGGMASAGGGSTANEGYNDYAHKLGNSAAVERDDDEAKRFNREWFRYLPPDMEFRTRDYSPLDRASIEIQQILQRGLGSPTQRSLLTLFASHHQKMILVDYEEAEDAVGFVMGHNLLRNYWDTDEHPYQSGARLGFAPWQDISSRVHGPALYDLNENFMTAWDKAQGSGSKFFWNEERKTRSAQDFLAPAQKRGKGQMAQICRTQSQENDKSILDAYRQAIANARNYLYFENQYFRYRELAELIRTVRRKLKSAGWPRDFYIFVVTNQPDSAGRTYTYEMLAALRQGHRMPGYHREAEQEKDPEAALRQIDLVGINIHITTLATHGIPGPGKPREYPSIYVHSKLLLADDIFFTLGSANINVRSMETDSELNIACPSPAITRQFREHLWSLHTTETPQDNMKKEFQRWQELLQENGKRMKVGEPLVASLVDFYDNGEKTWFAPD